MAQFQPISSSTGARMAWAGATLVMCITVCMGTAAANPTTAALQKAQAAFDAQKFDEAVKAADTGLAVKKTDSLLFIKARAKYELGKVEEAWQLIQQVQPGRLVSGMTDAFEVEYPKIEAAEKERLRKAKSAGPAPKPSGGGLWKWLVAGGLTASGGAFAIVGASAMTEANTEAEAGNTATYSEDFNGGKLRRSVGMGLAVVGVGVGVWALLSSSPDAPDEAKQARSWHLTPTVLNHGSRAGSGLLFSGRF